MDNLSGRLGMIVAHPDDETLWGGGIVLRNRGDWTIQCCSVPTSDPIRADKFHEACERLGAKGRVLRYPDQYEIPLGHLDELSLDFDVIVTHGPEGEYGHPHHVQVGAHVRRHATCRVISFGYDKGRVLELTTWERQQKIRALKAYDHVLPYNGTPMKKWEALLVRYGPQWLEREYYR